jgi:hypothetical protein
VCHFNDKEGTKPDTYPMEEDIKEYGFEIVMSDARFAKFD